MRVSEGCERYVLVLVASNCRVREERGLRLLAPSVHREWDKWSPFVCVMCSRCSRDVTPRTVCAVAIYLRSV
jgi:hypothetical protein